MFIYKLSTAIIFVGNFAHQYFQTIPLALGGKDVVAMARTGSGKTACFILPILEKLMAPNNKPLPGKNFRALVLSPTRELALQVFGF